MLQLVTLHLARSSEFSRGSAERGYEIVAPVDASGHLDPKEWRKVRAQCCVTRFWRDEGERRGMLLHRAGGASGATWRIHYDGQPTEHQEKGVHLETHRFAEGEYLSLRDEDGRLNTFKIAHMRPVGPRAKDTASHSCYEAVRLDSA
jgi:hypothetical protein